MHPPRLAPTRVVPLLLGLLLAAPGFAGNGTPPVPIRFEAPVYPYNMRAAGLEGNVTVEFVVTTTGAVDNPVVVASNNPWFERPAIDGVLKWKFKPGRMNGRPVNTRVQQQIRFQLFGGGDIPWGVTKGKDQSKLPPELQWDEPPVPVVTAFPVYPFEALRSGKKGKTQIMFMIGPEGRVYAPKVLEATTPEMGLAVLAMIDTWRFTPAHKKDGRATGALLNITHEFDPAGRGDAPVTDEAQHILRVLKKHPEQIATLRDIDHPPVALSRRPPVYPTTLAAHGQAGEALIEFYIDEDGDAQLPRIVSATAPEFGYAAAQAIATWRFKPATRNGKPAIVRAEIPLSFAFNDEARPADHAAGAAKTATK